MPTNQQISGYFYTQMKGSSMYGILYHCPNCGDECSLKFEGKVTMETMPPYPNTQFLSHKCEGCDTEHSLEIGWDFNSELSIHTNIKAVNLDE